MRALLLAAGLGTRLRPISDSMPKCLVPVQGKPLLGHWLDLLFGSGCMARVLINTHYMPDTVRRFVWNSRWREQIRSWWSMPTIFRVSTCECSLHGMRADRRIAR
jgi:mannose-1-phosphate guanylyltransferase